MPDRKRHLGNFIPQDDSSSLSLDVWTHQHQGDACVSAQRPEAHEWDLADGLMSALSVPVPPGSPTAAAHMAMLQQLQLDAAQMLTSSSSPDIALRAMRFLTGCSPPTEHTGVATWSGAAAYDRLAEQLQESGAAVLASGREASPGLWADREATSAEQRCALRAESEALPRAMESASAAGDGQLQQVGGSAAGQLPSVSASMMISALRPPSGLSLASRPQGWASGFLLPMAVPGYPQSGSGLNPFLLHTTTLSGSLSLEAEGEPQLHDTRPASAAPRKSAQIDFSMREPDTPSKRLLRNSRLAWEEGAAGSMALQNLTSPRKRPASARYDEEAAPSKRPNALPSPVQARRKVAKAKAGSRVSAAGQQSSSKFRGVSRHRLTQRWEASLWLSGKQLYLGGFESEEDAAKAYDIAALASKGKDFNTNFPAQSYQAELAQLRTASKEEIVAYVRRRSSAFSRGRSPFRGVSGQDGRWEARIGSFDGKKNVSFGIFETEEQAARQYDRALIIEKGRSAKTNFALTDYEKEVDDYKALLSERFGSLSGRALRTAEKFLMPLELNLPGGGIAPPVLPDKSKGGRPRVSSAAFVFAESLRKALIL